jgi:hypothetical protein
MTIFTVKLEHNCTDTDCTVRRALESRPLWRVIQVCANGEPHGRPPTVIGMIVCHPGNPPSAEDCIDLAEHLAESFEPEEPWKE